LLAARRPIRLPALTIPLSPSGNRRTNGIQFGIMAIKTVDMDLLATLTGNIFESVSILSKRSRQIARNTKMELDEKLAYFEGFEQELEDPRFQEEQARVSLEYEKKSEPTERAIDEMVEGEVYFRDPAEEEEA